MAKSKRKARWGYRADNLHLDGGAGVYSETDMRQLAKDFQIDDALQAESLEYCLGSAADEYRSLKEGEVDAPRAGNVLAALAEIEKRTGALDTVLGKTDTITWNALRAAQARRYARESKYPPDVLGHLDMGDGFFVERIKLADGTLQSLKTDCGELRGSLRLLLRLCEDVRQALQPDRGGPAFDRALHRWVLAMHAFWTDTLGRRFTLDAVNGKPVSPAARFCWTAFRPLEPKARPAKLMNAMQRVITEARRDKTRKNPTPK